MTHVVSENASSQPAGVKAVTGEQLRAIPKQIKIVNVVNFMGSAEREEPGMEAEDTGETADSAT